MQMKQLLSGETLFAPEILGDWYTGEQVDAMFLNSVKFLLDNMCDSWCRAWEHRCSCAFPQY